jgi:hypothetical protein
MVCYPFGSVGKLSVAAADGISRIVYCTTIAMNRTRPQTSSGGVVGRTLLHSNQIENISNDLAEFLCAIRVDPHVREEVR